MDRMLSALTPVERQDLVMSVGVHVKKRRANPMRVAHLIEKARATESLDEIANHLNLRDTTMLGKFLSLNGLPKEIQILINWGRNETGISFSVGAEITRIDTESQRRQLAQMAIEHRLSRSEVQAIVQRANREGCSVAKAGDEILKLRTEIERHFLFVGMLDGRVPDDIARRNIRRNLAALVGGENILAVRCGDGRFSVVLNAAGANSDKARVHLDAAHLQAYINSVAAS